MTDRSVRAVIKGALLALTGCRAADVGTLDAQSAGAGFAIVVRHDRSEYESAPRLQLRGGRRACAVSQCSFDSDVVGAFGPNGHVLLATSGYPLSEFDSAGRFVRRIGALGSANGQYISADHVSYDGQGAYSVLDRASLRLLSFDTTGRWLGSRGIGARRNISGLTAWPGGIVVFMLPAGDSIGALVPAKFAVQTTREDRPRDLISVAAPANAVAGKEMQPMRPYFLPMVAWAVSRTGAIHFVAGTDATVARFGPDGARDLFLDAGIPPHAVTRAEVDAEKRRVLAMFDNDARIVPYVKQAAKHSAKVHAPITQVSVLGDGSIWLREYAVAGDDSVRWNAFHASGRWRGWVKLRATEMIVDGDGAQVLVAPNSALGATSAGETRRYWTGP